MSSAKYSLRVAGQIVRSRADCHQNRDRARGDGTQAKATCQDFFILWKDADAEIPVLKRARSEFAKLQIGDE